MGPHAAVHAEWLVFDESGRAVGTLRTPPSFHLEQVGAEWVLGVHVDAMGVQTVRRHRLVRTP